MTYGHGGPPSGQPPYGPPQGQPYGGQPGYGERVPQLPPYGPPSQYNPPQRHAPPGQGRPSRQKRRRAIAPPGAAAPHRAYGPPGQYGPPGPYAAVPAPARRRRPERPTDGPVTDEDERWAVPAYVGMFVSGFVAPAIVLSAKGRTSNFARFHAAQALNLFVVIFIATFIPLLLLYSKGLGWLPLVLLVLAADCFVVVWAAIRANRCEWYRLPALVAWRIFR